MKCAQPRPTFRDKRPDCSPSTVQGQEHYTGVCNGQSPEEISFIVPRMRRHLKQCLEEGVMRHFPAKPRTCRHLTKRVEGLSVFFVDYRRRAVCVPATNARSGSTIHAKTFPKLHGLMRSTSGHAATGNSSLCIIYLFMHYIMTLL